MRPSTYYGTKAAVGFAMGDPGGCAKGIIASIILCTAMGWCFDGVSAVHKALKSPVLDVGDIVNVGGDEVKVISKPRIVVDSFYVRMGYESADPPMDTLYVVRYPAHRPFCPRDPKTFNEDAVCLRTGAGKVREREVPLSVHDKVADPSTHYDYR